MRDAGVRGSLSDFNASEDFIFVSWLGTPPLAAPRSRVPGQNCLASRWRRTANDYMRALPHTASCFVCGESNASGLKIRFETDGAVVRARFVPRAEHIGFKRVIHGGIIATLLDEIMVWACAIQTKKFAYCAELNVRYLRPARPGEEVLASAELVANRKNKLFEAKGEVHNAAGLVLATGTGKYLPVKEADAAGMMDDFVGDTQDLFDPAR